jgi:hypothetical protein
MLNFLLANRRELRSIGGLWHTVSLIRRGYSGGGGRRKQFCGAQVNDHGTWSSRHNLSCHFCRPMQILTFCPIRAQTFNIIVDTGSSDLWVASTACAACPRSIPLFNPSTSDSFNATSLGTTITYGQGRVTGQIVTDDVTMGVFSVPSQRFRTFTIGNFYKHIIRSALPAL